MDENMGVMDLSAPVRRTDSPVNYSSPSPRATPPFPSPHAAAPPPATTTPTFMPTGHSRRNLRRAEPRNFNANNPDQVMSSDDESGTTPTPTLKTNGYENGINGGGDSSDDDVEMPELPPIKELSPAELKERERLVRILRDELRNEEMTLVLLKKLRQSQQMKENIAVTTPTGNAQTTGATPLTKPPPAAPVIPSGTPSQQPPQRSSSLHGSGSNSIPTIGNSGKTHNVSNSNNNNSSNMPANLHRGQMNSARNSSGLHIPTPLGLTVTATNGRGIPSGMQHPNSNHRNNSSSSSNRNSHFSNDRSSTHGGNYGDSRINKDSLHISVANQSGSGGQQMTKERLRSDDGQTPAQRQAAAKLALRKQLEKTLLQIPPPKPPPPEMHFIPNPSNTEFVYLLGLEHIVDFITKENKTPPPPPEPFRCSQCDTSFTPVWKWEKSPGKGREPKVICESCVTTNVKKALKAEHTNRLKTAFVKALQQEQEIEQRLAQASPSPVIEPPPPVSTPKPVKRSNPTPPTPQPVPTPPRDRERERDRESHREAVSHREQRELHRETSGNYRDLHRDNHRVPSPRQNHTSHRDREPHRESSLAHRESNLAHRESNLAHRESNNHREVTSHRESNTHRESSSSHRESSSSHRESNASHRGLPAELRDHPLAKLAADNNFTSQHAMAAAALHQQLLRGLPPHQQIPAHMLPFSPLLYPYQLAMAQAASGNKNSVAAAAANLAELQRQAADLQRQYLLDMIPNPGNHGGRGHGGRNHHNMNHNWK